HGWTYVIRYEPNYFGKRSFTSPKSLKRDANTINVGDLEEIAEKVGVTENKEGKIFIDLESLGYIKLLGKGRVTKPFIVKVSAISEIAAEKIKEAGGEIITETKAGA
ncbi:uL15 family ribosomal protein, partial [Candidatus Bathyarchaeota archaeon]|nr:uL15 family ribosomal protein [Candidatus Bathyarchaeota archaeon]